MFHALAPPDARQNVGLLIHAIRRKKHQHRFAHDLRCRVAEDLLGAAIPGVDRPIQGLADNGVIGGIDDGGQAFPHFLRPLRSVTSLAAPEPFHDFAVPHLVAGSLARTLQPKLPSTRSTRCSQFEYALGPDGLVDGRVTRA